MKRWVLLYRDMIIVAHAKIQVDWPAGRPYPLLKFYAVPTRIVVGIGQFIVSVGVA